MSDGEETYFVTDDSRLRPGGQLDPDDRACLREAGARGKVRVVSSEEFLDLTERQAAKDEKPEPKEPAEKGLSAEEMRELAERAEERMHVFAATVELLMTDGRAAFVRDLRCRQGLSWRAVARACHRAWKADWEPPSNQIAGMAVCAAAAGRLSEDWRKPPWN